MPKDIRFSPNLLKIKRKVKMQKRKEVFKGKLLNLYKVKHKFPNGYIGDLEVVMHPGAVLIVPLLGKDRIVMIKQYRPVINSYIWELPAGTLGMRESPIKCAKRELIEEVGYKAKMWKRLGSIYTAPGYTNERIIIFEARRMMKEKTMQQEDEIIKKHIFTKKEVSRLFKNGKIVDAKTVCALKLARIL